MSDVTVKTGRLAEVTDQVLTAGEAALLLKVSTKTLLKLARAGELPGRKVGRAWRFVRDDLLALCASREQRAAS